MEHLRRDQTLRIGFTHFTYFEPTKQAKLHFLQNSYPACTTSRCRCERKRYHLPSANLIIDCHIKRDRRRRRFAQFYNSLNEDCPICYNSFFTVGESNGPIVRLYPCKHIFHQTCYFNWYRHCTGPVPCPYCRRETTRVELPLTREDISINEIPAPA